MQTAEEAAGKFSVAGSCAVEGHSRRDDPAADFARFPTSVESKIDTQAEDVADPATIRTVFF